MSVGRSNAYWAANRYADEAEQPAATAPLTDLPAAPAARFAALRTGLLGLAGVGEVVRFMGSSWRWAWEYSVGSRKLCWIHVVGKALSVTFTMTEAEEDRLRRAGRVSADMARAIAEAQRTGPVRWCWLPLDDRRAVDGFLRLAARKAEWLAERPTPHRAPRARRVAAEESDDSE
ncbi:MAG TPA: DUF3788 family protein [Gemmatimonadales bacterium]|jgi:hypothetical protein|nr:DUF3788 family protein [Gemmatimonadales bacterium]